MSRLNDRAFNLLLKELRKHSQKDPISQQAFTLVLKDLERLRLEKGRLVTLAELQQIILPLFPEFSDRILIKAAQANRPSVALKFITGSFLLFGGFAGIVWMANLPYRAIRQPISKVAPVLLLPSYMSMDYHYRGAIASVEQADQLVNNATDANSFAAGAEKVKEAQEHLDALPVWFLGDMPGFYCRWWNCSWRFTMDEFRDARQKVARMDARVLQENNALMLFDQNYTALQAAMTQYQQAPNAVEREKAILAWQTALDQMEQIPPDTLAQKLAAQQLKSSERDFENGRVGTLIAASQEFALQAKKEQAKQPQLAAELWEQAISRLNQIPLENPRYLEAQKLVASYRGAQGKVEKSSDRSTKMITAAKRFAFQAAKLSQKPPHPATTWEQIAVLWQEAIGKLENISIDEVGYDEAQRLLANYQTNLGIIKSRIIAEQQSLESLQEAKRDIQRLIASIPDNGVVDDRNQLIGQMQGIIDQLYTVKAGTTSYAEARQLLQFAQKRLKQI